ncbi:MAG: hypothetical protein KY445_02960 [Armatimonadetes bacterium]|nr:hypothetical protein [Armatimonadota bacterium]
MRFRPLLPLSVCLASGALVAVVWGQTGKKPAPKSPVAPSANGAGNVIIRSPEGAGVWDDTTGIGRITKDVTIAQGGEDFILYAQDVIFNRPQNRAVATGNLRVETRDSTIRGARIDADFNAKKIVITGNVTVTTRGKGDGITGNRGTFRSQLSQKSAKILSTRADWDYEDRQGVMTGNIRMTQGDNSGTCERILYDEAQNVARLQGNVRFRDKNNRVFNTPDLTIYINESRIVAEKPTLSFGPDKQTSPTPRAPKTPILKVQPAPNISEDDLKLFATPVPALPTPRPQPTRARTPVPAPEPAEAPEAPEAAEEPAN